MTTHQNAHLEARAVEALYATGHWLLRQERHDDAACVFRAMLVVAPRDERSWLGLARCHEALGQDDVAFELYTAACSATDAPRCQLARGRVLRRGGDVDAAREAFETALDLATHERDASLFDLIRWEMTQ